MSAVELRPHQREALEDIVPVLAGHGRATGVMACGTGKTLVGAATGARLAPDGPVFVAVPTIELLGQTAAAWASYDPRRPVVAVCSDGEVLAQHGLPGRAVTTSSTELAGIGGPAVVVGTYASLDVVSEAHRVHGLAPWGLTVIDEAHRTAGVVGKAWGAVHDDALIPSQRRLNLTATPRYFDTDADAAVSMDDQALFGPVAHRLGFADAIGRKLLSDYRVVVPLVTDAVLAPLLEQAGRYLAAGESVDARTLALAVAAIRAADRHRMRKAISYHSRIPEAAEFSRAMRLAAQLLGEPGRPRDVGAGFVHGEQPPRIRAAALKALRDSGRELEILANVKILGEGVDVPAVDGVVFAYAKTSMPEIIQAVGRALRLHEDNDTATIVIPVFVPEGITAEQAVSDSGYAGLWNVLQALRAFDERLEDPQVLRRVLTGGGDAPEREGRGAPRMFIEAPAVPEGFAQAIEVKTLNIDARSDWLAGCLHARRWFEQHGHLNVPGAHVTGDGFALGRWIVVQRGSAAQGGLLPGRREYLDTIGMIWNLRDVQWSEGLRHAAAHRAGHGHLEMNDTHRTPDGFGLGSWLKFQRAKNERGELDPARRAALEALGMRFENAHQLALRRGLAGAAAYRTRHGHLNVATDHIAPDGFSLGRWLTEQRSKQVGGRLDAAAKAELDSLGIVWTLTKAQRWQRGLEAATAFQAEYGHLRVLQSHVGADGYRLGVWIAEQRKSRTAGIMTPEQIAALDVLGMIWRVTTGKGGRP